MQVEQKSLRHTQEKVIDFFSSQELLEKQRANKQKQILILIIMLIFSRSASSTSFVNGLERKAGSRGRLQCQRSGFESRDILGAKWSDGTRRDNCESSSQRYESFTGPYSQVCKHVGIFKITFSLKYCRIKWANARQLKHLVLISENK